MLDKWLSKKADKIQSYADQHSSQCFYEALKCVYGPQSSGTSMLLCAEGTELISLIEIRSCYIIAITSANKIQNSGNIICHKRMATTSAICKTTVGQHQPIHRHNTCMVVKHLPLKPSNVQKIAGHTNTLTPSVLDIIKNNIFFSPEEAMLETGKSLSSLLKIKFCLREIFKLNIFDSEHFRKILK